MPDMVIPMAVRTYSELVKLRSFEDRYRYLKIGGRVGEETFGYERYLNQILYRSQRWKDARNEVIVRDKGCDLGIEGYEIRGRILVHHMNPITIEDIELERDIVFDPEVLISTTHNTHNAIHYGDESLLILAPVVRTLHDTCPWKR